MSQTQMPVEHKTPTTPRWVKMFGLIVGVLILLGAIILIIGGGNHGPNMHTLPMQQRVQQP